ncbi:hypothetical protein V498_08113, partial [Pseudogymnoascus sp. VKM F-4517 (FW-2822)]
MLRSTLHFFGDNYYPTAEIYTQRRSAPGIMDIAYLRYYKSDTIDGPMATSVAAHRWTAPMLALMEHLKPAVKSAQTTSPAIFLETRGAVSIKDAMTGSLYNLRFASTTINIIEKGSHAGIDAKSFGIITPYLAQLHVYEQALRKLHSEFPDAGFNHVLVGTTDSMEGNERPIIIFDSGVTNLVGFTNDKGRCLARAKDIVIVVAQPAKLETFDHVDTELKEVYKLAHDRKLVRYLRDDHVLYAHRYVSTRVQLNQLNLDEIENANL